MSLLNTPVKFLKGMGEKRAEVLSQELGIRTYEDLLYHFPYRYIDKSQETRLDDLETHYEGTVHLKGTLVNYSYIGVGRRKRLSATLQCGEKQFELVWFHGIAWVEKTLHTGTEYMCYGRMKAFDNKLQIVHPELDPYEKWKQEKQTWQPLYNTTEILKKRGITSKTIEKLQHELQRHIAPSNEPEETLPAYMMKKLDLIGRKQSLQFIHFPTNAAEMTRAQKRIKLEEVFWFQLYMGYTRSNNYQQKKGPVFKKVGDLFLDFYKNRLDFTLTNAQKRVLKEIRKDTASGYAMSRLLQGDVGSGKTIVALLSMLLAIDNGYQAALVAPTEVLAQQHFNSIADLCTLSPVNVAILTGSSTKTEKDRVLTELKEGTLHILIGTHALFEKKVAFKKLGIAVIDEQHRFGVQQRAALLEKESLRCHALIMTATPIPRTLAMTAYADLSYSVIDELPAGRKPVKTIHRWDSQRIKIFEFILHEILQKRQVYIVFPLIEESEKLYYEDLMTGYEQITSFFNPKNVHISLVHGRMSKEEKSINMKRFVEGTTQIMVATTVIEVGVNVPNASVMMVENSEKFGLSQLHQLRGRVGRGNAQSYCILLSSRKMSNEAKMRIQTMCHTTDGFKIAEKDLELRGPGDVQGIKQSGELPFRMCNLVSDKTLIFASRRFVNSLLTKDRLLENAENSILKKQLQLTGKDRIKWLQIG